MDEEWIELSTLGRWTIENLRIVWMRGLKERGEFNVTLSFLILATCGIVNVS